MGLFLLVVSIGPRTSVDCHHPGHTFILPQQLPDSLLPQNEATLGSGLSPGEGGGKHFLTHSQVTPFPSPLPVSHPALQSQPASPFTHCDLLPSHPHISLSPFMGQLQAFITPVSLTPARFVCQPGFMGRTCKKNTKGLEWFGDSHFSQNFGCPLIRKRNHDSFWGKVINSFIPQTITEHLSGTRDTAINKTAKDMLLWSLHATVGGDRQHIK